MLQLSNVGTGPSCLEWILKEFLEFFFHAGRHTQLGQLASGSCTYNLPLSLSRWVPVPANDLPLAQFDYSKRFSQCPWSVAQARFSL